MDDKANSAIPLAPMPEPLPGESVLADDSGQAIIALLGKAAQITKESCAHAMDVAQKLSVQMRAAEERIRKAEADAAYYRDRATRAEAWMIRIREQIERLFFQRQYPVLPQDPKPEQGLKNE